MLIVTGSGGFFILVKHNIGILDLSLIYSNLIKFQITAWNKGDYSTERRGMVISVDTGKG